MADWQTAGLIGGIGCLVLVLSGLIARRVPLGQTVKMALAWVAIFLVAALIVGQRDKLAMAWNDAFGGSQQVQGDTLRVKMAEDGHFWVNAEVNGRAMRFLVDSGATTTAISLDAAQAAGVEIDTSGFAASVSTANGVVEARRATVKRLEIGPLSAYDLPVLVAAEFGDTNVLGMNFLSRFASWRVEGRWLILQPYSDA